VLGFNKALDIKSSLNGDWSTVLNGKCPAGETLIPLY